MRNKLFLGIDAGGTKTRAVAVNLRGEIEFIGEGGPGNFATSSHSNLKQSFADATHDCGTCEGVFIAAAGILSDSDRMETRRITSKVLPGPVVSVEPDFVGALAACPTKTSACVIAGTGSVVVSGSVDHWRRSGGGGHLFGDSGSGFSLGRTLLTMALHEPTRISDDLREQFFLSLDVRTVDDAIASIYRAEHPPAKLAEMAGLIAKCAVSGDITAKKIVESEMSRLAITVARHVKRNNIQNGKIVLAGGLWKAGALLRLEFEKQLQHKLKDMGHFPISVLKNDIAESLARFLLARKDEK